MKKILFVLLIMIAFIFCSNSVKAVELEITCQTSTCVDSDFELVQLTATNTSDSGVYKDYASYFESYYQSVPACVNTVNGCTPIEDNYQFTMSWSSAGGFSALNSKGFANLTQAIGTSASYTKAGTYAFMVRQTAISNGGTAAETEYIVYVNVKSDLTVGSVVTRRIKDWWGSIVSEKVTELSFQLLSVKPTDVFGQEVDFYLSNFITGEYADKTLTVTYDVEVLNSVLDHTICQAHIIDSSGNILQTYGVGRLFNFTLGDNQAFIITKGCLMIGQVVRMRTYSGLYSKGFTEDSNVVANGEKVTPRLNETTTAKWNEYSFTLGGQENYAIYTWDYPMSNVPDTGLTLKVFPYVIIGGLIIAVGVLVIISRKRKTCE